MPVLGSHSTASQDNQPSQMLSTSSTERPQLDRGQQSLQQQQSASSQLERKLQQASPIHRNDEDGLRRGSAIEEIWLNAYI